MRDPPLMESQPSVGDRITFPTTNRPTLFVKTLGRFMIRGDGPWQSGPTFKKGRELLAHMLAHPESVATREKLVEACWPGLNCDEAAHRVHLAASGARSSLRKILNGFDPIECVNNGYAWRRELNLDSDLNRFFGLATENTTDAMRRGVELYHGEYFEGDTGDWLVPLRARISSLYLMMLLRLANEAYTAKDFASSVEFGLRAIDADRGHEEAARLVMKCFMALGRRSAALAIYDLLRNFLRDNVGIEPSPETSSLLSSIGQNRRRLAREAGH